MYNNCISSTKKQVCFMDQTRRHLIAVDLDDTILSTYYSLSSESVRALIDAQNAGHVVMIATARPEAMALPYHRAMGFRGPISTLNGSCLYHPDDPDFPMISHPISPESTAAISDAAHRLGIKKIWIEQNKAVHAVSDPAPDFFYFREVFRQSGTTYYDRLPAVPAGRIYACADAPEQADGLLEVMSSLPDCSVRRYITPSGEHRINCNAVTADKWYAVRRAAELCGVPESNIVVFGDASNDRLMVTSAAHGYVLCNGAASFVEEMRSAGVNITEFPCSEGGVGREIRKLLF